MGYQPPAEMKVMLTFRRGRTITARRVLPEPQAVKFAPKGMADVAETYLNVEGRIVFALFPKTVTESVQVENMESVEMDVLE